MNWLTSRCAPLAALATLALAGCDKGTDLNVDLPTTTAISTEYQDLTVDVATVRLAPVQTLKTDHFLVGRLADNVAGTTEARAYFNVVSGGIPDSLPSKLPRPVLDSVVLVMGFDKVYGSATTPVKFDVYKLNAPLDEREVYDGNTATPLGAALGQNLTSRLDRTQQVTTAATTTAAAYTSTVPDQTVRLLLQRRDVPATAGHAAVPGVPLQFATDLFAQLVQPNFDQPQLDAALKGLAVLPSAGHTSSIVSFGRAYNSRMTVYFHAADTLRRSYPVFLGPVYSSGGLTPSRDPRYYTQVMNTLPPALAALANRPGIVPATVLGGTSYVQEGTGLGTRVTLTGLAALLNTPGLTVNRAELRVPIKPFTNALFPNPSRLYAVEVDGNNNVLQRTVNFLPTDRVVQADGYSQLGTGYPAQGPLVDASTNQPYYSLPITNYLQAYLNDKLDGNPASLVLVPNIRSSATLSLNRAALDAANIKLRVYYSKR
ncbi:MAG: hypothetical protein NVS3B25_01540 [Hymenobacter sp.]